ncbi:hypothetical protein DSM112329_00194 [Paraconexibacter sp. AEG42_29]|uniref:DUF932 domain-containing protein n=1 Tax=Paraconexibacter sp. AEG42_29 TaxID=2997339 RepID=A0AAU7APT3_9ACTN
MASDRQQFDLALRRWHRLHSAGRWSASWFDGITAVVTSSFTDNPPDSPAAHRELASFRGEGEEIANRTDLAGGRPLLLLDPTRADIDRVIQDDEVANVYFVGNGSLSMLWMAETDRYDWQDVSSNTTHLKQGWCYQRQCGGLTRRLNVPLGLFMLARPTRLVAALDDAFDPPSLDHPANECMTVVMEGQHMVYDTFVAGRSDFGRFRQAAGFDQQTFVARLRQLRDVADNRADEAAATLARTLMERFAFDSTGFVRSHRRLIDSALADSRSATVSEVARRLDDATMNAAYLRRVPLDQTTRLRAADLAAVV